VNPILRRNDVNGTGVVGWERFFGMIELLIVN